jgi:hypothetical protein
MVFMGTPRRRCYRLPMADTVSLREAAQRLGKSDKSIRRYLAQGWLAGQLVRTPHGERWIVTLPEDGIVRPPTEVVSTAAPTDADLSRLWTALEGITRQQERILAELAALRGALLAEPVSSVEMPAAENPRRWWQRVLRR